MDRPLLGVGWRYPIDVDEQTGQLQVVSDVANVEQSIMMILRTMKGELPMRPKFGSTLHQYTFSTYDITTRTLMETAIIDALVENEARIHQIEVTFNEEKLTEGCLLIVIQYELRLTNQIHNFVYPFYLYEGVR